MVVGAQNLFDFIEKPDAIRYTTLINEYCLVGKMDEAMRLRDDMVSIGLKADDVAYDTFD